MITRADAEETAARWALNEAERLGRTVQPMVHEFDLGFIVWTRQVGSEMPEPGSGSKTVLDRESGDFTYYSSLSTNEVEGRYRDLMASRTLRVPSTVDKIAELRRQNARPITPNVAAHLALAIDGKLRRAFGAKSDSEINHHRFVKEWLDTQPAGHLVRGVQRHAELIVVSDTLYELENQRPVSLDEARALLSRGRLEAFHVREPGDDRGGRHSEPCYSCTGALIHLGLRSPEDLHDGFLGNQTVTVPPPDPGRFPADVAPYVVAAGWFPHGASARMVEEDIETVLAGPCMEVARGAVPVAREVLARYGHLLVYVDGPGLEVRKNSLTFEPERASKHSAALAGLASRLGQPLFPLGWEMNGHHSVLAIDGIGRVFIVDQAGDWLVGNDIDAALINLIRGNRPMRLSSDGTFV